MRPILTILFKIAVLAGVAQWAERDLGAKGLLVQFLVRVHAWVVGQVPSRGYARSNHTLMFLFPSPLSKNK